MMRKFPIQTPKALTVTAIAIALVPLAECAPQTTQAPDIISKTVSEGKHLCEQEGGKFRYEAHSTFKDINNDGRTDLWVVDAYDFKCSINESMYSGTGGRSVTFATMQESITILTRGFELKMDGENQILIKSYEHGFTCGKKGFEDCISERRLTGTTTANLKSENSQHSDG